MARLQIFECMRCLHVWQTVIQIGNTPFGGENFPLNLWGSKCPKCGFYWFQNPNARTVSEDYRKHFVKEMAKCKNPP